MEALIDRFGYDFITSFHVDLNHFSCTMLNTLAFNALKMQCYMDSIRHSFMDSLSSCSQLTPYHQTVQEPVEDGISPHFALRVPTWWCSYEL
ncbi:hypothetical protein NPIL_19041 [Nephila pilipes]|uniref:Uncharacterized protein n=1 Tax=Nephila pilipes TaxID=299642 RepID=A0A8X6U395_NEPPI|nr:hypothetical protein NPIL_19041 [Nephila pilipes]